MDFHGIITNVYGQILIPVLAIAVGIALWKGVLSKAVQIGLAIFVSAALVFMSVPTLKTIGSSLRDGALTLLQIK